MDAPHVDWATAEVNGDRLTVQLAGDRPRGWKRSFGLVATLLAGGSPFGDVSLTKGRVTVQGVGLGAEDELRFFLEAVVMQANADHDVEDGDDEHDDDDASATDADERDDPQSEMTARFRSFAGEESS
jgi:hypothetical protein